MGNLPCVLTDFVVSLKRTKGREKKTKSRSESPDRREIIGAMPGKAGLRRLDFAMEAEEPAEIGGSIRATGAKKGITMPMWSGKTEPKREGEAEKTMVSELSLLTGQIAGKAARLLDRELDQEADTKRARELAAILKDMSLLYQQLRGGETRQLVVRFLGETEEGGK